MQSDIVERLREVISTLTEDNWHTEAKVAEEAATEITALRERVAKLEGALSEILSPDFARDWDMALAIFPPKGLAVTRMQQIARKALYASPSLAMLGGYQFPQTVPGRFTIHPDPQPLPDSPPATDGV